MKMIRNIDKIAFGMVLAGAMTSVASGIRTYNEASEKDKKTPRGTGAGIYYGILGAASLYKLARILGPKTKEDKRLMNAAKIYDKADYYQHQANAYRRSAEDLLKRRLKSFKTATSS